MSPSVLSADTKIAVLGLGYVGLPLAHALAAHFQTVGFDIDTKRVAELYDGHDRNLALSEEQLSSCENLTFTVDSESLSGADIFIVTAPTPIDSHNQPDLTPVINATGLVAESLRPGNIVIFESTVYPGATEEECVPLLEQLSGLQFNSDFFVGYSPERINPGDKAHSLSQVVKVTSGSTDKTVEVVDALYATIIEAGTHRASSIKVAEAAKVIENTQRDLNIALMNELAILFDKLGIDTQEVLQAAGSKWNFLPFRPGLVGGHCIGVDPYYLTHKALQVGHHPEVILAGRRINDSIPAHIAWRMVRLMLAKKIHVTEARVLILGLSFKENCPDTRNSKVTDIVKAMHDFHVKIEIYDPWVDQNESEYMVQELEQGRYDGVIVAVAHHQFVELGIVAIRQLCKPDSVVFDVKCVFPNDTIDGSL